MKRTQGSAVLWMMAVFSSGIIVGGFGYHAYTAKTVTATTAPPVKKDTPEEWRRKYIGELRTRLELSDAQVDSLNRVLDDTKARFKGLKERHKVETDQIKAAQTEAIRAMLKPEQRPGYEEFRAERERKAKEQAAKEQAAKEAAAKAK